MHAVPTGKVPGVPRQRLVEAVAVVTFVPSWDWFIPGLVWLVMVRVLRDFMYSRWPMGVPLAMAAEAAVLCTVTGFLREWPLTAVFSVATALFLFDAWKNRPRGRRRKLARGCLAGIMRIASMVSTLRKRARSRPRLVTQPDPV